MSYTPQSKLPELLEQGYDQLEIFCSTCRGTYIKQLRWIALYWHGGDTLETIVRRLRCSRCNQRPDPSDVKPTGQADAPGAGGRM
jgi:hypothetical protein